MRIAWFTPFNVESAIGEFSQHVCNALAALADVELWTSDGPEFHLTDLPLIGYHRASNELRALRGYDLVVYNFGNYREYHSDIYWVSQQYPGVAILHDRSLHHMFADLWLNSRDRNPPLYVDRMGDYYGPEGAAIAQASLEGVRRPIWESDEEVIAYPLYEEAIANAFGVITHSRAHADEVRRRWLGPVAALELPCYTPVYLRAQELPSPPSEDRLRLLTIGHLNPNKQVHRLLRVLIGDPDLAAQVDYRVVGSDGGFASYTEGLRRQIAAGSSSVSAEIVGWLPNEQLEAEMQRADVFVNLRQPNIEGSSASLMKQLAFGRPVLCFDSGVFGELPEGSVMRVPLGDLTAVAEALRALTANPALRADIGERARSLAACYNERRYAERFVRFAEQARRARPSLQFVDKVARELGRMNVDARLPIFDEISADFGRILPL
jgi:glycosyltransferase involved in cell wall biosynthesis